jgi:hypothetical protein
MMQVHRSVRQSEKTRVLITVPVIGWATPDEGFSGENVPKFLRNVDVELERVVSINIKVLQY